MSREDDEWILLLRQKSSEKGLISTETVAKDIITMTRNGYVYRSLEAEEIEIDGRKKVIRRVHVERRDRKLKNFGWVINEYLTECMLCANQFSLCCRWRHHCRCCGALVCDPCSLDRAVIEEMEKLGPVRVCKQCYWGQSPVYAVYPGGNVSVSTNTNNYIAPSVDIERPIVASSSSKTMESLVYSSDSETPLTGTNSQTASEPMSHLNISASEGGETDGAPVSVDEARRRIGSTVQSMSPERKQQHQPQKDRDRYESPGTYNPINVISSSAQSNLQFLANCLVPIVIDQGSALCKAGFAGDAAPRIMFPCLVGTPKYLEVMDAETQPDLKDVYYGFEAERMRGVLSLRHPVERGVVADWEAMESIWAHVFEHELRVGGVEDHPVMLTEAPLNPRSNRERTAQVMFESFQVPALYVKMQAVLALLATGQTTGMAVDCGDGVTHTVPVFEGYAVDSAVRRLDLAGSDLTAQLMKLLRERNVALSTTAELEIVRDAKERLAYVALDFDAELGAAVRTQDATYELPDGQVLTLGSERFRCAEPLFQPLLMGRDVPGLQQCVCQSADACEIDLRRQLLGGISLSGGTSMLPGLAARLTREVTKMVPAGTRVSVATPADRRIGAWVGGSVLASLDSFQELWVTKADYAEHGENIVHTKCF